MLCLYYVFKRPYLEQFLEKLSMMGEVHIFTASTKAYADPIIDEIDPHGYITGRYYREVIIYFMHLYLALQIRCKNEYLCEINGHHN